MSQLTANDVFDELKLENTRLSSQLLIANQCLSLLNEYRNYLAVFNDNCNCKQNDDNKAKFIELENRYNKTIQKSVINSEHNYSFATNATISSETNNKKTIADTTANNISTVSTSGGKKFVVIRAKQSNQVTNAAKIVVKTNNNNNNANAVKTKNNDNNNANVVKTKQPKDSSLKIEDLNLSEECVKNLLNTVCKTTKNSDSKPQFITEMFRCDEPHCLASFYKLAFLKRHKRVSHPTKTTVITLKPFIKKTQNNFVEYKFEALDKQTKVIKYEMSDENDSKLYRCFECDFSHKSEAVFNRHYDNVHKLHKCPYCDKSFRRYGYKAHIRNIHLRKMCVCDKCGKTFSRKNFLRHSRIHGENTYKCDVDECTYVTNNATNLRSHRLCHKPKPIKCDFPGCKRSFSMNCQLRHHYNVVHGNHKRYECTWPECSARFKYTGSLAIHVRSKHTGEKPFACDWPDCNSKFGSKSQLQFHYKVVHLKLKKYVCDWPGCSKTFSLSCNLECHMRVHLNQRNFKCDYPQCVKSYYSSDKLKRHKKIHS